MSLFFIVFVVSSLIGWSSASQNLTSPVVTNWGTWGQFQYCPTGTKVVAAVVKTDPWDAIGIVYDDTCMNGVKFYCGVPGDSAILGEITSTEGEWGRWGKIHRCNGDGFITGFMLRSVEANTPLLDETASNNLRVLCSGSPDGFVELDGEQWGEWTNPRICDSHEYVCGLQTQVEEYQGPLGDDTALNNVRVACCDL